MSTGRTWQTVSTSSQNTLALGAQVGRKLRGGEVIELVSDLGGGKTTFVKGLAHGLGSTDTVSSPSFTLNNEYRTRDLTLHHLDFYRLGEAGIMTQELAELLEDPKNVVVIEWGKVAESTLPTKRLIIEIRVTSEESREFIFNFPEELNYLVGAA